MANMCSSRVGKAAMVIAEPNPYNGVSIPVPSRPRTLDNHHNHNHDHSLNLTRRHGPSHNLFYTGETLPTLVGPKAGIGRRWLLLRGRQWELSLGGEETGRMGIHLLEDRILVSSRQCRWIGNHCRSPIGWTALRKGHRIAVAWTALLMMWRLRWAAQRVRRLRRQRQARGDMSIGSRRKGDGRGVQRSGRLGHHPRAVIIHHRRGKRERWRHQRHGSRSRWCAGCSWTRPMGKHRRQR